MELIDKGKLYEKISELESMAIYRLNHMSEEKDITTRLINTMQLNERTTMKHLVADFPTVEAVPVVHGNWIVELDKFLLLYECSECSSTYPWATNFCPNCGADMRKERR